MRILFVATEAAPIAKVGGMGDVVGTLPQILKNMGHDVRLFMPYYGTLPDKMETIPLEPMWQGNAMFTQFDVYETTLPGTDVTLYLFGHASFAPNRVYGGEGEDWRFMFFANGAAEFAWHYWQPEIIHCHDWHTGMIPVWMHESPDIKTIFTIHNLAYQGPWRDRLEEITWFPNYMQGHNAMAAAVQYADIVNTVSPTYAQQIQTPEYGEKLEGLLAYTSGKLHGIVNGIDVISYNPATDTKIAKNFTADSLDRRQENKTAIQKEMGLEVNNETFLLGLVSRLVEQKGLDILLQILDPFMAYTNAQFLLLGTGDSHYENQLREMASRYPGRMSVQILYNDAIARRIYAGSDAFVMPSRFEPCGISQMLAMRYGCIPLVRRTGGLVDTVTHHNPALGVGTGYCFDRYEAFDLYTCMVRAWEGFQYQSQWQQLQKRAMTQDFSWQKSALEYEQIYQKLLV